MTKKTRLCKTGLNLQNKLAKPDLWRIATKKCVEIRLNVFLHTFCFVNDKHISLTIIKIRFLKSGYQNQVFKSIFLIFAFQSF